MQFSTVIYTLPNSGARLTQCCKLTIVQTETTNTYYNIRHNLIMANIYKHAFTFWHRPWIEPHIFGSQVGHSNHYSTVPLQCVC